MMHIEVMICAIGKLGLVSAQTHAQTVAPLRAAMRHQTPPTEPGSSMVTLELKSVPHFIHTYILYTLICCEDEPKSYSDFSCAIISKLDQKQ